MRLDLGLQRFHARFEHRALELFGLGLLGGLVRSHFRSALAARHHLDDERGDDQQEEPIGGFSNAVADRTDRAEHGGQDQTQEGNEQKLLP
jgi:hypothetical protein